MTKANPPEASALVVEIPPADSVIGSWRARYDPTASHGMPAHVTLLYPFRVPAEIDGTTLAAVLAVVQRHDPFVAAFREVATFPANVVYLVPDPAEPFRRLAADLADGFPECPPYGGAFDEPIPHLTVGHTGSPAATQALVAAVTEGLEGADLRHEVTHASLYTRGPTGAWVRRAAVPFGRSDS